MRNIHAHLSCGVHISTCFFQFSYSQISAIPSCKRKPQPPPQIFCAVLCQSVAIKC